MFALVSAALAASVYVNGVKVDSLRNQTFENCTVFIDSKGDVQITAPGYRIEVASPTGTSAPPPAATTTSSLPPPPATVSSSATPPSAGIGMGRYWLVTEDNGSKGHTVDVSINGQRVSTVRSGEGQIIIDVGAWMRPGTNQIRMTSNSISPGGGTLYVYIGSGSNDSGTVVLDRPDVQYGLASTRTGSYSRDYTIEVH